MEGLPKRKGLRLSGYDYSAQGAYFLTVCTHLKRCTLSTVRRGDPCGRPLTELTALGNATEEGIRDAAERYRITTHAVVIMPNHVHLLISLPDEDERATARVAPTVGRFVGAMKSLAVHKLRKELPTCGPLWQRGYHDHIIRGEADYSRILRYMDENPAKWAEDCYYIETTRE